MCMLLFLGVFIIIIIIIIISIIVVVVRRIRRNCSVHHRHNLFFTLASFPGPGPPLDDPVGTGSKTHPKWNLFPRLLTQYQTRLKMEGMECSSR
mmetsp:Transcript_22603/g.65731  ORF Transcript_22603/g.65731 Transcript_22603/m.65731 type:complete len:94 (+) Transcript_22603:568-849(+)